MQDSLLNPHHRAFIVKNVFPNELDRVFTKYRDMLRDYKIIDVEATRNECILIDSPRYYMFILGLLALQLGCQLSRKHRRWMKDNLHGCLLNDERLEQAKMAVELEAGSVLKLESQTLNDRIVSLAEGTLNFDGLSRDIKVPAPDRELAILRIYLDNEVARSKGATATKGVDISGSLTSHQDVPDLELAVVERQKMSMPQARVDMNPEQGFKHWISFQESRGRKTEDEHIINGWTRKESVDDEMRVVFRSLVQSGLLASYDRRS